MVMKLKDDKRNEVIKENEKTTMNYEMHKKITDYYRISMKESMGSILNGDMLITKDSFSFSNFLFEIWEETRGVQSVDINKAKRYLWYTYIFTDDKRYVFRFVEKGVVYHVFYVKGKNKNEIK